MKKIIILFFIVFQSCGIQYDGETKLEISGKLVDKTGNFLLGKNISVNIIGNGNGFDSGQSQELISFCNSGDEGKFTMLVPSPINENGISINIENSEFLSKTILLTKKNFTNYKLDLNTILLTKSSEISNLKIILNKTSTNKQILDIKIEGLQYQGLIDLNYDLTINQYYDFLNFTVFKNQTIILKYKIQDYTTNTTTSFSENIAIANDSTEFTITY